MAEQPAPHPRRVTNAESLTIRRAELAQRRQGSFTAAIVRRYRDIDGGTYSGLTAIELFTTVLPLIILGFAYMTGFASNLSPGTLFNRQLGLHGDLAQFVRDAFGTSEGLHTSWTFVGLVGFLIWGMPMAITVATMFARAWLREELPRLQRLWRGVVWFTLFLVTLTVHDQIAFAADHGPTRQVVLFAVSLLPIWIFWTVTPVLLVRNGGRGARFLAKAGLAGVVIDGIVLTLAFRLLFPPLLAGWTGFGPIGVAMAAMTWCGVLGMGWVVTACVSAVIWERSTPPDTIITAETDTTVTHRRVDATNDPQPRES